MTLPEPPVNVRLILDTEEIVPVDCVYVHRDAQGIHLWEIIMPERAHGHLKGIKIQALPEKTTIAIPMPPRPA